MACRLSGANPLPEPMLPYCQFYPLGTNISEIWIEKINLFIHENAFQTVICEMAAILSRGDELTDVEQVNPMKLAQWVAFMQHTWRILTSLVAALAF